MTRRGGLAPLTRHDPTSDPRSAYGPAWSIRAVHERPTSSGPPARWTSLCSRLRPETRGPAGAAARVPSAASLVVVRSAAASPRRRGPRPSRPSHARFRSSPIASWSASSSFSRARLTAAGTSSARRVAGVPGRSRVRGGEDLVVADRLEQPERRAELRVRLAAEPDDHVGRDRDPRDRLADPREPLEVVLDRVLAAHPAEDRVVAATGPGRWRCAQTDGQSAIAAISRSERSHGCEVTNRRRGIAGTPSAVRIPSMARISAARSGRPWRSSRRPAQRSVSTSANRVSAGRSWPYELTFWPSSVTSR